MSAQSRIRLLEQASPCAIAVQPLGNAQGLCHGIPFAHLPSVGSHDKDITPCRHCVQTSYEARAETMAYGYASYLCSTCYIIGDDRYHFA
jgi:hypothetical protein